MKSIHRAHVSVSSHLTAFLLVVVVLAAAWAAACGSSSTNVVAPTAQKCQISVNNFTQTFGATGGTGSASISAARECDWSAATQASWISLGNASGSGDGTITFTVAPNQVPQARSGSLAVNNQQLTVSQAAAPCQFSVSPAAQVVPAAGGTFVVTVDTVSGCAWAASTADSWLRLAGGGANGTGSVGVTVAPNTGADRTGTIAVAGRTVSVAQAAFTATPTPTPGCSYVVTPALLSFGAAGGQATVQVDTSPTCTWQAASAAPWLAALPAAGKGPGTVTVSATANPDAVGRSGTVTISGQSVAVSQDAAAGPATPVQLSGIVSKKSGDCPALSFLVGSVAVVTDGQTVFVNEPCNKIKNGWQVLVDGMQVAGQPVQATRVTVTNN